MNGKYRNWCFTSYADSLEINSEKCNYYIYQKEVCPETGREHWQGYIECPNQKRLSEIKNIIGDEKCHVESRQGTQQQAIDYCKKKKSRKPDCMPIVYGNQKRQGGRSELDCLWDCIESGMTQKEILMEHRGIALKHINMIYKGCKAYHEVCDLDHYIKMNRKLEQVDTEDLCPSKIASEVAGNTDTATNKYEGDLDDETLKKDRKKIQNRCKYFDEPY